MTSQCGLAVPIAGRLDRRMGLRRLRQRRFLGLRHVDKEHVSARLEFLFELFETHVGRLDTPESALPGEEADRYDREEDEGDPPGMRLRPAAEVRQPQHTRRRHDAHGKPIRRRVEQVFLHERGDVVQLEVALYRRVVETEHMDPLGWNPLAFQLHLESFQVIQVFTDEVVPQHFHLEPPSALLTAPRLRPSTCWIVGRAHLFSNAMASTDAA